MRLEGFAAGHPLREEPRALLMLALYRAGRAPEALEVHRRFRTLLADVVPAGHLGNESILLLVLADAYAIEGRLDEARTALLRARRNPGPYRGMIVDLHDARLDGLPAGEG